jgi:hypothetical protein
MGTVTYWNAYVANTQMYGKGTFIDSRLDTPNSTQWRRRLAGDVSVTAKLPALHLPRRKFTRAASITTDGSQRSRSLETQADG